MTEKQSLAWNLYMQTGLTQQKIAELTGVNRKTLYDWIKQGNWSRARTVSAHAPGILLDQYYGQLVALNDNIASRDEVFPTREDTVIMTRVNSVIKSLLPDKKSLATTIEHFTDFSDIIKDQYPELGDHIATLIKNYITDVLLASPTQTQCPPELAEGPNSHLPKQSEFQIPNSQLHTNGVQNGVSAAAEIQPKPATSKEYNDLPDNTTPQDTIQKWGATDGQHNTSLPEPALSDSRRGEGRREALPPPRNRSERRAQERLLKKVMKSRQAA